MADSEWRSVAYWPYNQMKIYIGSAQAHLQFSILLLVSVWEELVEAP